MSLPISSHSCLFLLHIHHNSISFRRRDTQRRGSLAHPCVGGHPNSAWHHLTEGLWTVKSSAIYLTTLIDLLETLGSITKILAQPFFEAQWKQGSPYIGLAEKRNLPAAIDSYTPWSRQILSQRKERETRRRQMPPPQVPISIFFSCLYHGANTHHR